MHNTKINVGLDIHRPRIGVPSLDIHRLIIEEGIDIHGPKIDIDIHGPKIDAGLDIHENLPSLGAMLDENADININKPKLNIPKVDINAPGLDIHRPKIEAPQINIPIPRVDIHGNLPSLGAVLEGNAHINVNAPSLDILGRPKISGPSLDIHGQNLTKIFLIYIILIYFLLYFIINKIVLS